MPEVLVPLAIIALLTNLGYGVVLPVLPDLVATSAAGVGALYSAFSGPKTLAQIAGGVWADAAGSRRVLAVAIIGYAIGLEGVGRAETFGTLLFFRAIEGICVGLTYPAASALVLHTSPPERFTRHHAYVLTAGGVGMSLGPILLVAIGRAHARTLIHVLAAAALISAVGLLWVPRERTRSSGATRSLPARALEIARFALAAGFVALILPMVFGKLSFSVMQPLLPIHFQRHAFGDAWLAAAFAATGVLFAAVQPIVALAGERLGNRRAALVALLIAGAAFAAMDLGGRATFMAAYIAYVCAGGGLFTNTMGLVGERYRVSPGGHATIFGVVHAVTDVGMFVAPPAFLLLHERAEPVAFALLAALAGLAGLIFAMLDGRRALPKLGEDVAS